MIYQNVNQTEKNAKKQDEKLEAFVAGIITDFQFAHDCWKRVQEVSQEEEESSWSKRNVNNGKLTLENKKEFMPLYEEVLTEQKEYLMMIGATSVGYSAEEYEARKKEAEAEILRREKEAAEILEKEKEAAEYLKKREQVVEFIRLSKLRMRQDKQREALEEKLKAISNEKEETANVPVSKKIFVKLETVEEVEEPIEEDPEEELKKKKKAEKALRAKLRRQEKHKARKEEKKLEKAQKMEEKQEKAKEIEKKKKYRDEIKRAIKAAFVTLRLKGDIKQTLSRASTAMIQRSLESEKNLGRVSDGLVNVIRKFLEMEKEVMDFRRAMILFGSNEGKKEDEHLMMQIFYESFVKGEKIEGKLKDEKDRIMKEVDDYHKEKQISEDDNRRLVHMYLIKRVQHYKGKPGIQGGYSLKMLSEEIQKHLNFPEVFLYSVNAAVDLVGEFPRNREELANFWNEMLSHFVETKCYTSVNVIF